MTDAEVSSGYRDNVDPADLMRRLVMLQAARAVDRELIADLQQQSGEHETALANLQDALATARRIGAAIGIVMTTLKITEQAAFDVLAKISQRQNRKVRDVADDVVLTGTF